MDNFQNCKNKFEYVYRLRTLWGIAEPVALTSWFLKLYEEYNALRVDIETLAGLGEDEATGLGGKAS